MVAPATAPDLPIGSLAERAWFGHYGRVGSRLKQFALTLLALALVIGAIAWGSVLITDKGVDCGTGWHAAAYGVKVRRLNADVHFPRGADGVEFNRANSHFVTYCAGQGRLRVAESGVLAAGALVIAFLPLLRRRRRGGPDVAIA